MQQGTIKLFRADSRTGKVLDENYILFNKSNHIAQVIYTHFDDLKSAIAYVNSQKALHVNVEFMVFANDKIVHKDVSVQDLVTELYLTPNFIRSRK